MMSVTGTGGGPVNSTRPPEGKEPKDLWLLILLVGVAILAVASLLFALFFHGYYDDLGVKVIRMEGTIVAGDCHDSTCVGSEYIGRRLRDAADDPMVQAIVLRVNSPGGTPAGAQEIIGDMKYALEKKPVVVSMGDIATSGAYYVSAYADCIYADPDTITGGIGTSMTFYDIGGWLEDRNISVEVVKSGSKKDMGSIFRPLSEDERTYAGEIVNESFERFISDIGSVRSIPTGVLEDARVVRGETALQMGLIDRIGNLNDAIAGAGELAG